MELPSVYHWTSSSYFGSNIGMYLGSMLWSQFSASFDTFRRKNGVFLKNQCYIKNFAQLSFCLSQKRQFWLLNFSAKIIKKIITSVPGVDVFIILSPNWWKKIVDFDIKSYYFMPKIDHNISVCKKWPFFAEEGSKSPKIVIITLAHAFRCFQSLPRKRSVQIGSSVNSNSRDA
jgi:hypothetical protein